MITESDDFATYNVDGIFGLAYASLAAGGATPPFDSMVAAGLPNVFSLCLTEIVRGDTSSMVVVLIAARAGC
jgi:hypothetical protein